ncbi:AP-4 complex accessory subunit Tepsin [Ixodes scapularis]|uniref:AP-4 complex accessory subunit Tepsin n=1 Tax=Ixodes scapularis TaxID=6945 RepID=UPI001C3927D0|nr:AP-4 complex accessory subunit Tepsin [Ixodes scapularis]
MKSALKEDLSFLKKVPTLAEATANTNAVVPGYLYKEINSMTLENEGQHADAVLDYLLSELQDGTVYVKVKCLRILQYILQNGHSSLKRLLQRKDSSIRTASNISGSQAVNQWIREISKELLHAIHEEGPISGPSSAGSSHQLASNEEKKSLSGLGASAFTSGKYEGFGNAPVAQKTLGEQVTEGITKVVEKLAGKPGDVATDPSLAEALPKFQAVRVEPASVPKDERSQAGSKTKPAKPRKRGRVGGGWDDDDDSDDDGSQEELSGGLRDSCSLHGSDHPGDIQEQTNFYEKEAQAVESFAGPELDFPPSRKEITDICERCSTLNCEKIVELLSSQILCGQQNSQMRAMVMIEALLRKNLIDLEAQAHQLLASLQQLQDESVGPVQVKARKIILIIQKLSEANKEPKEQATPETECSTNAVASTA